MDLEAIRKAAEQMGLHGSEYFALLDPQTVLRMVAVCEVAVRHTMNPLHSDCDSCNKHWAELRSAVIALNE